MSGTEDEPTMEAAARVVAEPEPEPASAAAEAERVLRRGSGGRWLLRVLVAFVIVGASLGGGYLGYRALVKQQAQNAPMVKFPASLAKIGNDQWPDESPAHEVDLGAYSV